MTAKRETWTNERAGDADDRIPLRGNFNLAEIGGPKDEHRLLSAEQEWIDYVLHDSRR
jgi:hypothetical protein